MVVNLSKLDNLTNELEDLVSFRNDRNSTEYTTTEGHKTVAFNLYNNKDKVAVMRAFLDKGQEFPEHKHSEKEYMIIYEGSAKLCIDGEEKILETGDFAYVPPNKPHIFKTLENTWGIWITVPPSKGYPGGD